MKARTFVCVGFALASVPTILYSVYRAGYQIVQFTPNDVLLTFWQQLILIVVALIVLSFLAMPRGLSFLAGVVVAGAAMALVNRSLASGWGDYKLWVYVIAPFLFWTLISAATITAAASLLVKRKTG
jgi:hypothetical protein